jgi:hypothetical protein
MPGGRFEFAGHYIGFIGPGRAPPPLRSDLR